MNPFSKRRRYISSKGSRIYVGIKSSRAYEVFHSIFTPTERTHGQRYTAVIGPFRTMRAARLMEHFGPGNPHLQTVGDAERLARHPDFKGA